MSDYTLTVPEDVYERARQIAQDTAQSIDQVMLDHLKTPIPLPTLPPHEQAELDALQHLSDDALWTIAREQMPESSQTLMQTLMDKNNLGTISDSEYAELEEWVARGNRLMLRKAEAAAILMERGHAFTQQDFKPQDE
ncbi:MAG: hypothetical protein U0694_07940 [Anaerolineae bacterium]